MLRKYKISKDDFDIMEEVVQLQQPYKAGKPWKFAGSFYYATTVLTTIGKFLRNKPENAFQSLTASQNNFPLLKITARTKKSLQ